MNAVLEARKVSVSRGTTLVLDGLDLAVAPAATVAISGPSGSGKSTLLAVLAGLVRPESGEVWIAGEKQAASDRRRAHTRLHHLGIVFQGDEFLPELTLLENVALPSMLREAGTRVGHHADAVADLFRRLALDGLEERRPAEVSVGQLQRAAVARAVLGSPVAILADEPTSALDEAAARDALAMLLGLAREQKAAVCLVTHDPSVASLCDRRLVLTPGVLTDGSPRAGVTDA